MSDAINYDAAVIHRNIDPAVCPTCLKESLSGSPGIGAEPERTIFDHHCSECGTSVRVVYDDNGRFLYSVTDFEDIDQQLREVRL